MASILLALKNVKNMGGIETQRIFLSCTSGSVVYIGMDKKNDETGLKPYDFY